MHYAKFFRFNSLSFKVLSAFVLGVILSIALFVVGVFWISIYHQNDLAGLDISEVARKLSNEVTFDEQGQPSALDIRDGKMNWVFSSMPQDVAYRLLDDQGQIVLSSMAPDFWATSTHAMIRPDEHFISEANDISYHNIMTPVTSDAGVWYLQVTVSERLYSF